MRAHPRFRMPALLAVAAAVAVVGAMFSPAPAASADTVSPTQLSYTIDGNQADTNPADAWKGFGAVTANNTSRYLLDYKDEHPAQYWQIMNELFNPVTGMGLTQVKIELGSDGNTSSGTEPATMRTATDVANVLRGAGFHFAADARSINPAVQVSLLNWSQPAWITTQAQRFQWYKDTIDGAYSTYGLVVNWVDPNTNETSADVPWITYFAQQLKAQTGTPYDYSKIKIAMDDADQSTDAANDVLTMVDPSTLTAAQKAAAQTPSSNPATALAQATDPSNAGQLWTVSYPDDRDGVAAYYYRVANQTLMGLVSALTHHYSIYSTPAMSILNRTYGMQIWYSEGVSGTGGSQEVEHLGLQSAGQTAIDVANLFINSYSGQGNESLSNGYPTSVQDAHHTLYMFQPAVEAFPQGTAYSSKADITADSPWSGSYTNQIGYYVTRQFTAFASAGTVSKSEVDDPSAAPAGAWQYVDGGASQGTGTESGNAMSGSTDDRLTLENPEHTQFSTVITNNSATPAQYTVTVQNVGLKTDRLADYETDFTDGTTFDSNWFQRDGDIALSSSGSGTETFTVTLAPYSIKTITSLPDKDLPAAHKAGQNTGPEDSGTLDYRSGTQQSIVYQDDFEYSKGSLGYSSTYAPATTAWNYADCKAVNRDTSTNACAPAGPRLSYLDRRGDTPRYSNDMNGAFEVNQVGRGHALVQQLTYDQIPGAWDPGPPETLIGDDTWANYTASADVTFDTTTPASPSYQNYVGIGGRSNVQGNGFLLLLQSTGDWGILENPGDAGSVGNGVIGSSNTLAHGFIPGFDPAKTHSIALTMEGETVVATVDGTRLASWSANGSNVPMSGRVNLVSGWYHNAFDNLTVSAVPGYAATLNRYIDDGNDAVSYSGTWSHSLGGASLLDRTQSVASAGASFTVPFTGTGFQLDGDGSQNSHITVSVDGKTVATDVEESTSSPRAVGYDLTGLSDGRHTLTVTSVDGGLGLDAIAVLGRVSSGVDRRPLTSLIAKYDARRLQASAYSTATWSAYQAALTAARAALANRSADQESLDKALSTLQNAYDGLEAIALQSIEDTDVSTQVGMAPTLPGTVTPVYGTGVGAPVDVTWDTAGETWSTPGTVVVFGRGTDANGAPFATAKAVVTVEPVTTIDPSSVTVPAGTSVADTVGRLPATVQGQLGRTTQRVALPVSWDTSSVTASRLGVAGTFAVTGTAVAADGTSLSATLTVIVTAESLTDICADDPGATVTATYTEPGYSPQATCDGDTSGASQWSDWESGDRAADSLTYAFTHAFTVDSVTIYSAEKAASSVTVQYLDADGDWVDSGAGTVTGLTTTTTTTPSTVTFAAVQTEGIRVNLAFDPAGYTKIDAVEIGGASAQQDDANVCTQDSGTTVTASYTQPGYSAAATCTATPSTGSVWSDWVSGDRPSDSLTYAFTRDFTVSGVTVTSTEKAASSLTVQYRDSSGAWTDAAAPVTGLSTNAPTTVAFTPVTTDAIRVVFAFSPLGYTKIEQVAIVGSSAVPASVATLGELETGGTAVSGFAPGTRSYTVAAASPASLPTVSAVPADADAAVSIVQATAAAPTATITVTAADGTTTAVYTVTFTSTRQPDYVYYIDSGATQSDVYDRLAARGHLLNASPDQAYVPASTTWGYDTVDPDAVTGTASDPDSSYRSTNDYYLTLPAGSYQVTVGYSPAHQVTALSTVYDDAGTALAPTVTTPVTAGDFPTATSSVTLTRRSLVALNTVASSAGALPSVAWVAVVAVPPSPVLRSIVVVPPAVTRFASGTAVLFTGTRVVARYADGSTRDVTATASFAPMRDLETAGDKTSLVTFTDGGVTATGRLTVRVGAAAPGTS